MSLAENSQNVSEDQILQRFGYRQEYKRELRRFASFAIGFSFISMNAHSLHLLTNHTLVWFPSHIRQRTIPLSLTYEMASVAERHARAPAERQARSTLCLRY